MEYEEPTPIERTEAEVELASGDSDRISVALLRLTLHDDDPKWLEATLLPYLQHEQAWVRGVAAMCLGYVARLHGTLDLDVVIPAIRELLDDETRETRGKAEDALDDIEIFMLRKA
ncbi:MAG: hypothetical protein KC731_33675 [Myxococcales bacterium]|nr:hypothetical protein [Myxococcales bacterium]